MSGFVTPALYPPRAGVIKMKTESIPLPSFLDTSPQDSPPTFPIKIILPIYTSWPSCYFPIELHFFLQVNYEKACPYLGLFGTTRLVRVCAR
jgi:hypothetical protein